MHFISRKKLTFLLVQIWDQKVPFSFSWIYRILTSVCFTLFRLEQPDIKISKHFQIKTQYGYVRIYPDWYTKLKSCPFMLLMDWMPVCILSAHARGTAKYIIYDIRSMNIFKNCLSSLLGRQSVPLLEWIWNIVKQNDIKYFMYSWKRKKEMFCLKFTQVRT